MNDFLGRFLLRVKGDWRQFTFNFVGLTLVSLLILSALYQIYDIHTLLAEATRGEYRLELSPAVTKQKKENTRPGEELLFASNPNGVALEPPTKWHLNGIILEKNSKESQAVIASTDSDEAIYQIGNTLPDGAIVTDIQADRVLLSINGHNEILLIWDIKEKPNSEPTSMPITKDPDN